ncbi:hypothetical protein HMPREF0501_01304 [Limosilactobacillus coleohominis 101-4-CHN]|uniref:Sensor histidine kinase NatK-like C-terminal domain-containing protein n=2 Tax=Limosilactobacillus coleohominis TaxID=181675 RepID=C7XX19_9LACO|nr:hypothetical protein HMPREF0501_01304 [Limosilactobacillus coleohominis 101-4-CHN]
MFALIITLWGYTKITQRKLNWPYYAIFGFLGLFTIAVVNTYLVLFIGILILYALAFRRSVSFNKVATGFLISVGLIRFIQRIYVSLFSLCVDTPFHVHQRLGTDNYVIFLDIVYSLCLIIFVPLLIKLTQNFIRQYLRTVVPAAPLFTWLINLGMLAQYPFMYAVNYRLISITPVWQLVINLTWLLALYLLMYLRYRYLVLKTMVDDQQIELNNLRLYTSHIESMYDDLRRFRHDYKNVLYSLTGALENDDIQQSKGILNRVLKPSEQEVSNKASVLGRLVNIQNLDVKSLVYSKVMKAIEAGVDFQAEIAQPFKFGSLMDQLDVDRVLSILLDNAINAAQLSKDKQVNLSLFEKSGLQYIVVGNSTKDQELDLQKLDRDVRQINLTDNHGIGLKNLRMILSRYPSVTKEETSQDYWFKQVIRIPKV